MHKRVLVSPSELDELIKREPVVLIDTRDAASYAEAHLPGAVNIHEIFTYLATTTPEGLAKLHELFAQAFAKAGLSGGEIALVYEQSMTTGFGQSCRGYVLLRYLGYPRDKIKILHGGYSAWRNAGLPSTSEASAPVPATFPSSNGERGLFVDLDEMKRIVATPNIVKLDVRDVDEWIGESSSPYGKDFCPRKGRIPGSVWLEWYRMMKPTAQGPMFKSPSEILAECATVGIGPDTPVVVFCFKGARASNTFVALEEAGIRNVRLYLGSWNEWSRDLTLPIEEGLPY
ncbi:sulfurtransferase [Pseudomonas sp. URMO17WK12:I11]|uniref:sulfurtransferase n=1 Tax=Pseudomonas sp. URMO17WK12:I11 TaxID=1283291 RepID=UPI00071EB624|nr:sulfurtransferase [Pseudomonas sp. URMO17WK12:I11]CRL52290.1 Putative thiosulfate sulfurtransferase precursor [Pseudomonas sp. URMO17WK12:I11]